MNILVTTSRSLLFVNIDTEEIQEIDNKYSFFGLTKKDNDIYAYVRYKTDDKKIQTGIKVYDQNLQSKGIIFSPFPLRWVHEIKWNDDKLYVSCTRDDMIAIYDGTNGEKGFPFEVKNSFAKIRRDKYHFNSFMFEDDKVGMLAHNYGPSDLLSFDKDKNLVDKITLGVKSHNIGKENDHLYTCSSDEGGIISENGFSVETGGFPRGVIFHEGKRCVGITNHDIKHLGFFNRSHIKIYDNDGKFLKKIEIPFRGMILDMMLIPEKRS